MGRRRPAAMAADQHHRQPDAQRTPTGELASANVPDRQLVDAAASGTCPHTPNLPILTKPETPLAMGALALPFWMDTHHASRPDPTWRRSPVEPATFFHPFTVTGDLLPPRPARPCQWAWLNSQITCRGRGTVTLPPPPPTNPTPCMSAAISPRPAPANRQRYPLHVLFLDRSR